MEREEKLKKTTNKKKKGVEGGLVLVRVTDEGWGERSARGNREPQPLT